MTESVSRVGPATSEAWHSYRHLADNAIDVIFEASLETVIQWVSPSVEDVLGWTPDEFIGRNAPSLVHPEDMGEVIMLVEQLNNQARRVKSARCRLLTASGSYKPMQLRGLPALPEAVAIPACK